jgi:hypothetical protein
LGPEDKSLELVRLRTKEGSSVSFAGIAAREADGKTAGNGAAMP